jgi:hypothetical protein
MNFSLSSAQNSSMRTRHSLINYNKKGTRSENPTGNHKTYTEFIHLRFLVCSQFLSWWSGCVSIWK